MQQVWITNYVVPIDIKSSYDAEGWGTIVYS